MPDSLEKLILSLCRERVIQVGDQALIEHNPKSKSPVIPIYFNIRQIRSHIALHEKLVNEYEEIVPHFEFDLIADVPQGSTTIAWELARRLAIPMITPRPTYKDYGADGKIIGRYQSGQRVLIVDDVVVNGTKKQSAISTLENVGLKIAGIIAFLDWERGGVERLEQKGYKVETVIKARKALEILKNNGMLSEDIFRKIKRDLSFRS